MRALFENENDIVTIETFIYIPTYNYIHTNKDIIHGTEQMIVLKMLPNIIENKNDTKFKPLNKKNTKFHFGKVN